jgi:hypothetical protein
MKDEWSFLGVSAVSDDALWYVNAGVCAAHLIAAFFVVVDGSDFSLPLTTSYIAWKQKDIYDGESCRQGNCYLAMEFARLEAVPDISMAGLIVCSHVLSFSWQFLVLFDGPVAWFYYDQRLIGRNPLRWLEYALSAPLMIVVIAAVLGQGDAAVLALLAISVSALMAFGYLTEMNIRASPPVAHISGWILFAFVWGVVTFTFVLGLNRSEEPPPPEVLAVVFPTYVVMLSFFGSFGVVQAAHVCANMKERASQGTVRKYNAVEMWYAILSLSSKVALSVLLYLLVRTRERFLKVGFVESSLVN